jgi:plasmid stabilization system protein ParE
MPGVKWLPEAVADANRLYRFLDSKDADAATNAMRTILIGAKQHRAHPLLGRPMLDGTERRELFISFGAGAYVLTYRLENSVTVTIIRVWHSKENRL